MEKQTITLNNNNTECIRTISEWGYDHIHNICSGATTTLPWGLGQWASVSLLGLMGLLVASLVLLVLSSR